MYTFLLLLYLLHLCLPQSLTGFGGYCQFGTDCQSTCCYNDRCYDVNMCPLMIYVDNYESSNYCSMDSNCDSNCCYEAKCQDRKVCIIFYNIPAAAALLISIAVAVGTGILIKKCIIKHAVKIRRDRKKRLRMEKKNKEKYKLLNGEDQDDDEDEDNSDTKRKKATDDVNKKLDDYLNKPNQPQPTLTKAPPQIQKPQGTLNFVAPQPILGKVQQVISPTKTPLPVKTSLPVTNMPSFKLGITTEKKVDRPGSQSSQQSKAVPVTGQIQFEAPKSMSLRNLEEVKASTPGSGINRTPKLNLNIKSGVNASMVNSNSPANFTNYTPQVPNSGLLPGNTPSSIVGGPQSTVGQQKSILNKLRGPLYNFAMKEGRLPHQVNKD